MSKNRKTFEDIFEHEIRMKSGVHIKGFFYYAALGTCNAFNLSNKHNGRMNKV